MQSTRTTKEQYNKMIFKIAVNEPSKSQFVLTKAGADFSHNQIILNSIVGTLVKYGLSGRLEPYLAESWTVSPDKKNWQFKIRPNLKFADGTLITAELYKEILLANLLEYSKKGSVIMFDHLLGWSDFVSGRTPTLKGLSSHDNTVELNFDENPDDLLELLRMPYFGMWKEHNGELVSSGPYTIKQNNGTSVILALRSDWFTVSEKSFREVEVSFTDFAEKDHFDTRNAIVRMPFFVKTDEHQAKGYWISSPPTRLEGFVLSPTNENFFSNLENRQVFQRRVRELSTDLVKSKFFYPSARTEGLTTTTADYKKQNVKQTLRFALERNTYSEEELRNLSVIINKALDGSDTEFIIVPRDPADKEWFTKTDSNHFFDARVSSVDIGAYPVYTAIKMMFCTKLGINFPDPSGKICSLVSSGIKSAKAIDQQFVDQFNTILNEEAIIIPIMHHSDKWLVSEQLDPSSLPATTLYPQFELIRLR